ncbi:MAG TPA: PilZ domain-containing protein [Thermoanaerobaculia bacterium]|nr:PilZ domain-containing protein [Thermoanaerobaculia bacterium]HUM29787.1 PilZ domain-containing protein [Thermoanaerobaculia bacterium]HXK68062.1 PilZ domain-containing protein [Thermoanaerobaculia bacterium]
MVVRKKKPKNPDLGDSAAERRRHQRFVVEGLDVQCKMLITAEARLINISLGGAFISTMTRLNIGSEYTLRIECQDRELVLKGNVVWERVAYLRMDEKGNKFPTYEAGVRFKDVLTGTGADLVDFMERNVAEHQFHVRLQGLRVKILGMESATILDHHKIYQVKKLSIGGMLIVSDQAFVPEERFKMELIFPGNGDHVTFMGRIAYSGEVSDSRPLSFDTGIEFFDMEKNDRKKLEAFVHSLREPAP